MSNKLGLLKKYKGRPNSPCTEIINRDIEYRTEELLRGLRDRYDWSLSPFP